MRAAYSTHAVGAWRLPGTDDPSDSGKQNPLTDPEPPPWSATECHERIAVLRPDFLLLDGPVVAQVSRSELAGAELAGLNSFGARLDVCRVARGVDDAAIAKTV